MIAGSWFKGEGGGAGSRLEGGATPVLAGLLGQEAIRKPLGRAVVRPFLLLRPSTSLSSSRPGTRTRGHRLQRLGYLPVRRHELFRLLSRGLHWFSGISVLDSLIPICQCYNLSANLSANLSLSGFDGSGWARATAGCVCVGLSVLLTMLQEMFSRGRDRAVIVLHTANIYFPCIPKTRCEDDICLMCCVY